MTWEINQTDSTDADYTINYSNEKMISKSARINTFMRHTLANNYDFSLDVYMTPSSEEDLVIDLPSAKIRWNEKALKFIVDQKYANVIKQIKQQEDPKKAQELIDRQKKEEEKQRKQEEEIKRKREQEQREQEEAETRAAVESVKKNLAAIC